MLRLVTCDAFERASSATPESRLSLSKLITLAAGDGGRLSDGSAASCACGFGCDCDCGAAPGTGSGRELG